MPTQKIKGDAVLALIQKYWLLLLIILIVIVEWKKIKALFDGIGDVAEGVGSVLSLPSNIVRKIQQSADRQVHDLYYKYMLSIAQRFTYGTKPKDEQLRKDAQSILTKSEYNNIMNIWKGNPIGKLGAQAGAYGGVQIARDNLLKRLNLF